MIKKALLLGAIPLTILMIIVLVQTVSAKDIDYELRYGNDLDSSDYYSNSYIEVPNKEELTYNIVIPPSFELKAEDDKLQLYLEEETLAIAVRVKANGYVYSSYNFADGFYSESDSVVNPIKSGVTLELYKETTPTSQSYLDTREVFDDQGAKDVRVATANIVDISNGFKAEIDFDFSEIMIKFDLIVSIEDGTLIVDIPAESIKEYNPNIWDSSEQYYILRNIVVFPYFGSTKSETDGYVVIPDGSGALISLESSPDIKASFSLDVYGSDLGYMSQSFRTRALSVKPISRVTMPVYGVVHDVDNTGFLVVSESGANYAIFNFKSTGLINDYYNSYFSYRYRESYEQYQSRANEDQYRIAFQENINDYDLVQKYIFLSGTEANYVGLAKTYQEYLIDNDQLGDMRRSIYSSTPTKVDFIGSEITPGILTAKTTEITTYNEVTEILAQMKEDGYKNIITSYKTYNMNEDSYRFKVFRQLGGSNDFEDMISFLDENNIIFSYYSDYVRSYDDYSKSHAQTLSKRSIYYIELSWMFYAHSVTSTRYYDEFAKDDVKNLNEYNIEGISLNGFDRAIFTSYKDGIVSSSQNMSEIIEALKYFEDNDVYTNIYLPDAYLYKYVNEYYDAPISSSEFSFQSASIPFLQLVLGGYVDMYSPYLNFVSDESTSLLRMVEYGVFPSYILTGGSTYDLKTTNSSNVYISQYDVLSRRISDYYDFLNPGLGVTIGKEMTNHIFLDKGVSLVEYDNTIQILVNYNDVEIFYMGEMVPPNSYVVLS